jgi:hypothetical protein
MVQRRLHEDEEVARAGAEKEHPAARQPGESSRTSQGSLVRGIQ